MQRSEAAIFCIVADKQSPAKRNFREKGDEQFLNISNEVKTAF